jgi:hypothetical protein
MAKATLEIRSLARAHTETALRTLAAIMTKEDAPEAARVSAANSLLDRGWGKAEQHITVERVEDLTNEQLAGQLAEAVAALRELGVDPAGIFAGIGGAQQGAGSTGSSKLN